MATKKTTSKKAPAAKKTTVKVTRAKKTPKKASKASGIRAHVGLQPEDQSFMTFRLTRQTLYWLVLGIVVIMFTVWIMDLQADVQTLYDEIDSNTVNLGV